MFWLFVNKRSLNYNAPVENTEIYMTFIEEIIWVYFCSVSLKGETSCSFLYSKIRKMKFNSTAFFYYYLKESIFLGDCEDISANRTLLKSSQHVSKTPKVNPTLPLFSINTLFFGLTGIFYQCTCRIVIQSSIDPKKLDDINKSICCRVWSKGCFGLYTRLLYIFSPRSCWYLNSGRAISLNILVTES